MSIFRFKSAIFGGPRVFEIQILGSLSSDVFERQTSTGSEPFSLLVSLDATVFILPSVLILIETICPKICSKSRLKSAKRPLPVDVRRSKTSLLKLPILLPRQRDVATSPFYCIIYEQFIKASIAIHSASSQVLSTRAFFW